MPEEKLILYTTEDGSVEIQLRTSEGTVWLSQAGMAILFHTSPQAITQLLRTTYDEGELSEESTCKKFLQVQMEGPREIKRLVKTCNLKAILAIDYRGCSVRGIQFREWATIPLSDMIHQKGNK